MTHVVNCFRISIFAVAKTIRSAQALRWRTLWIAFELVSLQWQKQSLVAGKVSLAVVNCFRISIFAVAKTMSVRLLDAQNLLWIAFELVSLQWQKQFYQPGIDALQVVNCFRISIFAVAKTMRVLVKCEDDKLWIAFELVSLQWQKQWALDTMCTSACCELLSN